MHLQLFAVLIAMCIAGTLSSIISYISFYCLASYTQATVGATTVVVPVSSSVETVVVTTESKIFKAKSDSHCKSLLELNRQLYFSKRRGR